MKNKIDTFKTKNRLINEIELEQLGFGDWLKDNAGNILQTAGGVGLGVAGAFTANPALIASGVSMGASGVSGFSNTAQANEQQNLQDQAVAQQNRNAAISAELARRQNQTVPQMSSGGILDVYGATHEQGGIPTNQGVPVAMTGKQATEELEDGEKLVKVTDSIRNNLIKQAKEGKYNGKIPQVGESYVLSKKNGTAEAFNKMRGKYKLRLDENNLPLDNVTKAGFDSGVAELIGRNEDFKQGLNDYMEDVEYKEGGTIHIKPENKGKFTAWAKSHGKSVQEAAKMVMANKDKYSSAIVKKANFARQAKRWNHESGGMILDNTIHEFDKNNTVGKFEGGGTLPKYEYPNDENNFGFLENTAGPRINYTDQIPETRIGQIPSKVVLGSNKIIPQQSNAWVNPIDQFIPKTENVVVPKFNSLKTIESKPGIATLANSQPVANKLAPIDTRESVDLYRGDVNPDETSFIDMDAARYIPGTGLDYGFKDPGFKIDSRNPSEITFRDFQPDQPKAGPQNVDLYRGDVNPWGYAATAGVSLLSGALGYSALNKAKKNKMVAQQYRPEYVSLEGGRGEIRDTFTEAQNAAARSSKDTLTAGQYATANAVIRANLAKAKAAQLMGSKDRETLLNAERSSQADMANLEARQRADEYNTQMQSQYELGKSRIIDNMIKGTVGSGLQYMKDKSDTEGYYDYMNMVSDNKLIKDKSGRLRMIRNDDPRYKI